jgi:hypothetical protein
MRLLLGVTLLLAALVLPSTAFGSDITVRGYAPVKKNGHTPTLIADAQTTRAGSTVPMLLRLGFTKTGGSLASKTLTRQTHRWMFELRTRPGRTASIRFGSHLASGHVRAGGKMGTYGSARLTWTPTGPLKVRRVCNQTVRSRAGRLDGLVVFRAHSGFQTVRVRRYRATVTKTSGACDPPPPTTCAQTMHLEGSQSGGTSFWGKYVTLTRRDGRTWVEFFAANSIGRAFVTHTLKQLIPNGQFTNTGAGAARVAIPAWRAVHGRLEYVSEEPGTGGEACETISSLGEITGVGLTARFYGMRSNLTVGPAAKFWQLFGQTGLPGPGEHE